MTKPFLMLSHLYKLMNLSNNRRTRQWDVKNVKVEKGFEYIPVLISKVIQQIDCMMMTI